MTEGTSVHTRLQKSELVAERTMAFHFAKPPGFEFRAGQAIDLTLLNPPETDAEGNIRTFSLVSAPFDSDLTVATRLRDSAFKRVLSKEQPGLEVKIDGPSGSLVLHRKTEKPAVLLAGGIGITPYMSIVRQAAHDKTGHQIYLFYANRRPEDTPFLDVLTEAAKQNPQFHLIATMTEMEKSQRAWNGETGHIDKKMLLKYLPAVEGPIYYVAGPPAMVAAMRRILADTGVDDDDVRTEEFSGY